VDAHPCLVDEDGRTDTHACLADKDGRTPKHPLHICTQMCVLDGNAYDAKCLEAGQERDDDLDACSLLVNNKGQPLLQPMGAATHSETHKVIVPLVVRARP
jgi:hypothetical protein